MTDQDTDDTDPGMGSADEPLVDCIYAAIGERGSIADATIDLLCAFDAALMRGASAEEAASTFPAPQVRVAAERAARAIRAVEELPGQVFGANVALTSLLRNGAYVEGLLLECHGSENYIQASRARAEEAARALGGLLTAVGASAVFWFTKD